MEQYDLNLNVLLNALVRHISYPNIATSSLSPTFLSDHVIAGRRKGDVTAFDGFPTLSRKQFGLILEDYKSVIQVTVQTLSRHEIPSQKLRLMLLKQLGLKQPFAAGAAFHWSE